MSSEGVSGLERSSIPGRRRGISLAGSATVREKRLAPGQTLPIVFEAESGDVDLISWAVGQKQKILDIVLENGGILFRGFRLGGAAELERFIGCLAGDAIDYTYRSTPRTNVGGKIYTSTEYPSDQSIPMHNEMSYTRRWPQKIWFYSLQVAATGGETPIADSRKVLHDLDPAVRDRFEERGVMYARNYGGGVDLSWQNVFQTEDQGEVEDYCRTHGIELTWLDGDRVRTRQVCQAVARHPRTGEDVWFNQAHLFHVSSLDAATREVLVQDFGEEGLPRNAFYGDGTEIEMEALESIREAYRRNQVVFPWRTGDVLFLDNMLVAHGRRPFTGERKVVVGMADPWPESA